MILKVAAFGATASVVTGPPAAFQAFNAAVEHSRVGMAEIFQKPQATRRAHAGIIFVKNNFFGFAHAAQFEHVMNHEHECFERRFASVDQAQAEEIEVDGAGNMAASIIFRGPDVDEAKIRRAEFLLQLRRCCEKLLARVLFFHSVPIALVKMALQLCDPT